MLLPTVADFFSPFGRLAAVESVVEGLRRNRAESLSGLTPPAAALLVAHVAAELRRPVIAVVDSNARAEALVEPVRFFFRALSAQPAAGQPGAMVGVLPALDVLPGPGIAPHPALLESRAVSLWRYSTGQARILIASLAAARMRIQEQTYYAKLARTLVRDDEVPLEELVAHLRSVGYERQDTVEMPGQYTVRGGILDVFPPEAARPVRLELLGDTLESLREFDPGTQRSVRPLEQVSLPPLTEFRDGSPANAPPEEPREELPRARGSIFDLRDEPVVILEEPDSLAEAAEQLAGEAEERESPSSSYFSENEWRHSLSRRARLELQQLALEREAGAQMIVASQPTKRFHGNLPQFLAEVRARLDSDERVLVAAANIGEVERLADLCREEEIRFRLGETESSATGARLADDAIVGSAAALTLVRAPLDAGFVLPEARMVVYGTGDLFDALPARPRVRAKTAGFFSDFSDLKPGDHVVHVDHGIGRFEGLQTMETDGARGEFMRLTYADDARLYVPVERMDLVQAYRSLGESKPQLDHLGGLGWTARKARTRKSLEDMADQLLALYAERKTGGGHAFPPDSAWQKEFEDAFEFEETPDQATAIADVKRDMEQPEPMDRLLCGDVGYGKTEVAMRAAFKAVMGGKQVALLAPTTVLAFQHYETFRRRFAAFPLRIDMLSRFRSPKEQKNVLLEAETGKLDIVIGTHRLLSRDLHFHNLGLVVVDEEQRFGVAHKERLKELRRDVDVLTLSATPIPRTLHMSLVGLRNLSAIETPPRGRLAIQTVVAPFSEGLIQRAIEQEMARKGQVFFVHNRVESIASLATLVKKLVPKARIVIGHGQMGEKQLESAMMKFVRDQADVLVCTTIIENGLDIPRANTILVNRADRFGLSELYQLRGRVGRSDERAYAYLMVPPEKSLSSISRQRLAALREFSELGSGFRIAALDLELRGAGNLLGRQQHGHINAIGFDLYCHMLERAVAQRKGEAGPSGAASLVERRATVHLGLDIRIPPDYIPEENLRLQAYKRIAQVAKPEQRESLLRELADRFGPPPATISNLLDYAVLKAQAERLMVSSVERRGSRIGVKFYEDTPVKPEQMVALLRSERGLRLDPGGVLWIEMERGQGGVADVVRNVLLRLESQR